MDRREFLKLSGMAGLVAVSGAMPGGFLFKDTGLILGAPKNVVFFGSRPVMTPDARAFYISTSPSEVVLESGNSPNRNLSYSYFCVKCPLTFGARFKGNWTPQGVDFDYQSSPIQFIDGEDPHIAMLISASNLQRKIDGDIEKFSHALREERLCMVTIVQSPIETYPLEDSGACLGTMLSMFAARESEILNIESAFSQSGQIPLVTPTWIEFKRLTLLEEELRALGLHPNNMSVEKRRSLRHRLSRS